jgi:hypothetical protein
MDHRKKKCLLHILFEHYEINSGNMIVERKLMGQIHYSGFRQHNTTQKHTR